MDASGPAVLTTARVALVDRATAEAVRALAAAGVRSVLLKGPSLTAWLYGDGMPRPYGDSDLLVAPDDRPRAEDVLRALGYVLVLGDGDIPLPGGQPHADTWWREATRSSVDLHRTLGLARAPAEAAWPLLAAGTDRLVVEGVEVEVLGLPARALHVALHAAAHGGPPASRPRTSGGRSRRPARDVARRALARAEARRPRRVRRCSAPHPRGPRSRRAARARPRQLRRGRAPRRRGAAARGVAWSGWPAPRTVPPGSASCAGCCSPPPPGCARRTPSHGAAGRPWSSRTPCGSRASRATGSRAGGVAAGATSGPVSVTPRRAPGEGRRAPHPRPPRGDVGGA